MKGTIHKCIEKLITEKFGEEKWHECLQAAGIDKDHVFMLNEDVDDELTLNFVSKLPSVLGISMQDVVDAFGQYWVNNYAPKLYSAYYEGSKTAKDFILKMDLIHETATKTIPNAKPPRFQYEWKDDKTLLMTYNSSRGLIDFAVALIKGVGTYFKENLQVQKLSDKVIEIKFQ